MITRKGSAKWTGGLKDGKGHVSTASGALSDQPYGFQTRFEDKAGTNPEELIGAAHASCFSMAFAMLLEKEGISGISIQTTSEISMDKEGDGFAVKKAHLITTVSADADKAKILEVADIAKENCPISKLLNVEISMDATVA